MSASVRVFSEAPSFLYMLIQVKVLKKMQLDQFIPIPFLSMSCGVEVKNGLNLQT